MSKLPKLYKRNSNGSKIQEWSIIVDGDSYYTIHGQQDGKKITGEPTRCISKNTGRANETTPEEQALSQATAKWTAQKEKHHYVENISELDEETYFKVMLAKSYKELKENGKVKFPALYQNKLDGVRFVATSKVCHSRNGKSLGGMFAIIEALQPFFKKYPDAVLDGEAFNVDFNDDFQALISLIKRDESKLTEDKKAEIKKYVQYHVYDCPRINGLTESDNYLKRIKIFWSIIDNEFPELKKYLKSVDCTPVNNDDDVQRCYLKSVSAGFEGGILRYDVGYENTRTWNLLKIKEFMDSEYEIVEVLEGKGNKAGTAGSVTLKLPSGVAFNSNIKGGFAVYDEVWKNRNKLIGRLATCKYFALSNDGIPRFPYIIKFDRSSYE